jgi:hypothetical protein
MPQPSIAVGNLVEHLFTHQTGKVLELGTNWAKVEFNNPRYSPKDHAVAPTYCDPSHLRVLPDEDS